MVTAMSKVKNIIYSQWSAQRYAAGEKCRTQRVINWPKWVTNAFKHGEKRVFEYAAERLNKWGRIMGPPDIKKKKIPEYKCPYGGPGDRLQLLTTWAVDLQYDKKAPSQLPRILRSRIWTSFDGQKPDWFGRIRSPLHMPGWLRDMMPAPEIISIEARRIWQIEAHEIIQEGLDPIQFGHLDCESEVRKLDEFISLWDSLNAKRGYPWSKNPWVWNIRHQSAEELECNDERLLFRIDPKRETQPICL
jgi:hypothetical protein